jgi:UDP-glucose 4-epimerase
MILVTGGAGYIGSHVVKELINRGYEVVVLDNLIEGHKEAVQVKAKFIKGDIRNERDIDSVFSQFPLSAVIHFAAHCYVGESVKNPAAYYENNVQGTLNLLKAMNKHQVRNIVFSSSCAVYGKTNSLIDENIETKPINPYGWSKLMCEQMIRDFHYAYKLNYVILRYFNVAGADIYGELGEDHDPETHLIPCILEHLAGKKDKIQVYGNDYGTKDGTCIRDYIHVTDLANAHVRALQNMLINNSTQKIYNVGNEKGYSVKEIIQVCENVTNKKAKVEYVKRREGDPPILIASSLKIRNELNWKAKYELEQMIETAWRWFTAYPNGYLKMENMNNE